MSEITKPVEETPVAAPATGPVDETPKVADVAPETKIEEPVVPAATETPATTEEVAAAAEPTPAVAETPKEFSGEGVLGYKAPGGFLKKLAGFQKKFFWFGDEAVQPKALSSYLRGEKAEIANHNAAWSSQTGKGLLYFSKHATEKASPAGIINLAEISDITEDGTIDFVFHSHGHKHVFQASSIAERDSWLAAIKTKSAEAKESAETVKSSEGYKKEHELLSKPVVAVAAAAGAVEAGKKAEVKKEEKKEEKAEEKAEKKEEKAEKKEEKKEEKTRKDRSVSRKRNSIFGGFGMGSKKEEKTETPAEAVAPATTEAAAPTEPAPEVAPLDGPAVAAAAVSAPVVADETPAVVSETPAAESTEASRPVVNNKRNSSIFGNLSSRFGSKKSTSEEAPAVPSKDAPVIPEPEPTEPLPATVETPAPVVAETTEAPVVAAAAAAPTEEAAKPTIKSDKRKSSLPFGLGQKKEKTSTSDSEEKPKSPFAKLRQTVKGKTSPKAEKAVDEKAVEKPAEDSIPASEPTVEEPKIVAEPVATTSPAQVSATA